MRFRIIFVILCVLALIVVPGSNMASAQRERDMAEPRRDDRREVAPSVVGIRRIVDGVSVEVIYVDLRRKGIEVRPILAQGRVGASSSFARLIADLDREPVAAITGTFFDTRTLLPVGDIVQRGRLVHFGGVGAGLCFTELGRGKGIRAEIRDGEGVGRHTDWGNADYVLGGGMWLMRRGELALDPSRQGFRDPGLFRPTRRVGAAILRDGSLMLTATRSNVSLVAWANIQRRLGARDALNYDGGSSAACLVRGETRLQPGRSLTNILVVFDANDRPRDTGGLGITNVY